MARRVAQRNRTRLALLAAARDLMAQGEDITVARVADAAQISRATAYRYFSDPAALTGEAVLDIALRPTSEVLDGVHDVRERVHAIAAYYLQFCRDHEAEFRQYLAFTMRQWRPDHTSQLRGARRISAFADALEPVRGHMRQVAFDELVARLSMLTGLEQHIVLADILRADPAEGDRLQRGVVDAVLDRYLPEG